VTATTILLLASGSLTLAFAAALAAYPEARISNGTLQVDLLLPDAQNGYYRGTRFDCRVRSRASVQGPRILRQMVRPVRSEDSRCHYGPVEEFLSNGMGLGYEEAKPARASSRSGWARCANPRSPPSASSPLTTLPTVESGPSTRPRFRGVHARALRHSRYAYVYKKTVRLAPGKPEMVLEHSLRNTGKKPISTSVYEHNFYMLDHQPAGPDYSVRFPFEVRPQADLRGLAEARAKSLPT